jgi:hypothetical protein
MARFAPSYEAHIWKLLGYCGRYGHQQAATLMDWPLSQVRKFADGVADLMREEGDTTREHSANGGG